MLIEESIEKDEISIKELVNQIGLLVKYLKTHLWKITIMGILGFFIGIYYAWKQPVTYTAKTTFIVEDSKSGGGISGLASLAGQFGVDIANNAVGGLISGENILLYFKSDLLIRKVLISSWDENKSYADYYLEACKISKNWVNDTLMKGFHIPPFKENSEYSRLQDSVIQILTQKIITEELTVQKVDKKAGFIELSIKMKDEVLSKRFSAELFKVAIKQYIDLKTERQKKTVNLLQQRADSIGLLLNTKTSLSAKLSTERSVMDLNPIYQTSRTLNTEVALRDKNMLSTIYAEIVKNLELSKFTLSQETPVIQIVNEPLYPLIKNTSSKSKFGFLFSIGMIFILSVFLIIKKWIVDL